MSKGGIVVKFGGGEDKWRERLIRNRSGDAVASPHNLLLVLENDPELKGLFRLDEFANRVTLTREPSWAGGSREEFSEVDAIELAAYIGQPESYSINCRGTAVLETVEAVARRRRFHPVREYLEAVQWDEKERIPTMLNLLFGADASDYNARVGVILMVSAVARVMDPGCKVDTMIVLEGAQGAGKTRATRALFGAHWYAEAMESPATKDFYQSLAGRWCVEIGEMESFTKAEVNKVKQAITAQHDTYRPSYGRYARDYPRQCVFVGTTNDDTYLRDHTGARRFLPVRVGAAVNVDALVAQRDQLWAEALHLYRQRTPWWQLPEAARDEQDKRFLEDTWTDPIRTWLMGNAPGEHAYPPEINMLPADYGSGVRTCSTTQILCKALHVEVGKHGKPEQMRVANIMKRLGWDSERVAVAGVRQRLWVQDTWDGRIGGPAS